MFAQKLKQLRTGKNLTQDELAKQIHVSRSAIAKWEQGRGFPTEESTADLCHLFGVDKATLIDDEEGLIKRYYAHEKRKKILWISLSSFVVLALAGGISGAVLYQQEHQYTWIEGGLTNQLRNRVFLCKTGLSYSFTPADVVPEEEGITVSSIAFSGEIEGYHFSQSSVVFSSSGFFPLSCEVYDKKTHRAYTTSLGRFYVYNPSEVITLNTLKDFELISSHPAGAFELGANIDAKNETGFSPLCVPHALEERFQGVFLNPNHYWIENLSITPKRWGNDEPSYLASFFGEASHAYIDSLILKNLSLDTSTLSSASYAGGIAGLLEGSYLGNSTVTGTLKSQGLTGGLAGYVQESIIENCSFEGTIVSSTPATTDYSQGTGGLFGEIKAKTSSSFQSTVLNHLNAKGSLSGLDYVGGIVGLLALGDTKMIPDFFATSSFDGTRSCSGDHQGQNYGGVNYGVWYND